MFCFIHTSVLKIEITISVFENKTQNSSFVAHSNLFNGLSLFALFQALNRVEKMPKCRISTNKMHSTHCDSKPQTRKKHETDQKMIAELRKDTVEGRETDLSFCLECIGNRHI